MNFEPQKFFIGLMSFFTILLPGALMTFLFLDWAPQIIGEEKYCGLSGEARWMIFFVASYLAGHFIFLIGARFLDEYVYDKIRAFPVTQQVKSLANGGKLSKKWLRRIANFFVKSDSDEALFKAIRIKNQHLGPINASSSINTFQWSKARLTSENPGALSIVQQFEADSKFFRSLIIVLVVWLILAISDQKILGSILLLLLIPLALWRYIDQRLKSITQAYWYIITMEKENKSSSEKSIVTDVKQPTHAGGVVYRIKDGQVEVLLVQALNNPSEWVLPKGHIEPGETWKQSAVREVKEEANLWAKVRAELADMDFNMNDKRIVTKVFLMECVEEGKKKGMREKMWLKIDEAIGKATHEETKNTLRTALEQLRKSGV